MPTYESIFVINPNTADDETAAVIKKMQDVVAKQGGEMLKFEDWGKRKLAYEVKKHKRGHYAYFQIKAEPKVISELERRYKMTDQIIKYLSVKLDKELRAKPAPAKKKPAPRRETSAKAPAQQPAGR